MILRRKRVRRMRHSSVLNDRNGILVADTSVVISMAVCECAAQIMEAIPNRIIVPDEVVSELEIGKSKGYASAERLCRFIEDGLMEVVTMGIVAETHFEELTVGSAKNTLGSGEAATIACALEIGGIPLIDEGKARRICDERYPDVFYGCIVDIFAHREVGKTLGKASLKLSVLSALQQSRMRVPREYLKWVANLIGHENAAKCKSLPGSVRKQAKAKPNLVQPRI